MPFYSIDTSKCRPGDCPLPPARDHIIRALADGGIRAGWVCALGQLESELFDAVVEDPATKRSCSGP